MEHHVRTNIADRRDECFRAPVNLMKADGPTPRLEKTDILPAEPMNFDVDGGEVGGELVPQMPGDATDERSVHSRALPRHRLHNYPLGPARPVFRRLQSALLAVKGQPGARGEILIV
jgi:hypothetical protein